MLEICKKRAQFLELALAAQVIELAWIDAEGQAFAEDVNEKAKAAGARALDLADRLDLYDGMKKHHLQDNKDAVVESLLAFANEFPEGEGVSPEKKDEARFMATLLDSPALGDRIEQSYAEKVPAEYLAFLK